MHYNPRSVADLETILRQHHVGPGLEPKHLEHLFQEIENNKSTLTCDGAKLVRTVKVVRAGIRFEDKLLIGASQIDVHQPIRQSLESWFAPAHGQQERTVLLADTVRCSESLEEAVHRTMVDGLKLSREQYSMRDDSLTTAMERQDNPYFPGLVSQYELSFAEVTLNQKAVASGPVQELIDIPGCGAVNSETVTPRQIWRWVAANDIQSVIPDYPVTSRRGEHLTSLQKLHMGVEIFLVAMPLIVKLYSYFKSSQQETGSPSSEL